MTEVYEDVEVNLTPEAETMLLDKAASIVIQHDASRALYHELIDGGESQSNALIRALINDQITNLLIADIERRSQHNLFEESNINDNE